MTDSIPTPAPAVAPRWMRVALAVSVAINLGVAGMMVGAAMHGGPEGRSGFQREMGFGPFSEALTPEDRKTLRRALISRAPELRAARQSLRADMDAILAALRADPYDQAHLDALLSGQHERMVAQLTLGEDMIREFLQNLDTEQRRAFADRLEHQLRRGPQGEDAKTDP